MKEEICWLVLLFIFVDIYLTKHSILYCMKGRPEPTLFSFVGKAAVKDICLECDSLLPLKL